MLLEAIAVTTCEFLVICMEAIAVSTCDVTEYLEVFLRVHDVQFSTVTFFWFVIFV